VARLTGRFRATVGVIQTAQADVIGIQEVGGSAASIASSLGFYYHGFNSDIAIISRYPIAEFSPRECGCNSRRHKTRMFSMSISLPIHISRTTSVMD